MSPLLSGPLSPEDHAALLAALHVLRRLGHTRAHDHLQEALDDHDPPIPAYVRGGWHD